MNKGFDRIVCVFAMYRCAALVAVTSIMQMACGQEAIPAPPPSCVNQTTVVDHPIALPNPPFPLAADHLHRVVVNDHGQVTVFLTKLPHLGRLLQETCPGQTCCEELLERLGIAPPGNDAPHTERLTALFSFGCPCHPGGECTCAGQAEGGSNCAGTTCAAHPCDESKCGSCPGHTDEAKCGDENCRVATMVIKHAEHHDDLPDYHPLKLMQHIASLMAEKAAAEAALEAKVEAQEELAELYEAMADLVADNAALDAKLEAQAEQRKLLERLTDLATENARLKAHVELAAERAEIAKTSVALQLENERLKLRLADLEQRHAAEAARTAADRHTDRQPR